MLAELLGPQSPPNVCRLSSVSLNIIWASNCQTNCMRHVTSHQDALYSIGSAAAMTIPMGNLQNALSLNADQLDLVVMGLL